MQDAELARAVAAGDREAFATLYDRYATPLHDFSASVLRDADEARDAVQDTFVLAWERIGQLRDPTKLRAWMFAIARHEALRRLRQRRRATPTADVGAEIAAEDPDPVRGVSQDEAAAIVWEAAAGLSERDRVLLDLHVRQGLQGQELGDAIGVSASHAYVLVNRLRAQVDRSLGALLVARLGSEDCEELQRVLEGWDGTFSPLWRKRVARHVDDCDICSERRRALASPFTLLPSLAAVMLPSDLRDHVLERVRRIAAGESAPDDQRTHGWARRRDGFPPPLYGSPRRRIIAAAAAVAIVVVGGSLGASLASGDDDRTRLGVETAGATTTTSAPGPAGAVPPTSVATTSPAGAAPTVAAPAPRGGAVPAPAPDTTPPSISGLTVSPASFFDQAGSCAPTTTTVSASASDPSGIASVVMVWSSTAGSGSKPMAGSYSATLGPFPSQAAAFTTISVTVRATDTAGNVGQASTTAELQHCLF